MSELITLKQTASRLGVTYARAAEMVRTGVLPSEPTGELAAVAVYLGRNVRVNAQALEQFIRQGGKALPGGWRKEACR